MGISTKKPEGVVFSSASHAARHEGFSAQRVTTTTVTVPAQTQPAQSQSAQSAAQSQSQSDQLPAGLSPCERSIGL